MIIDLHAHYPMHVIGRKRLSVWRLLMSHRDRLHWRDRVFATLIGLASRVKNYRSFFSGPRVRIAYMREGGVGVALSVLYSFFDEVDVLGGAKPGAAYIEALERQLATVEEHVTEAHPGDALVVTRSDRLGSTIKSGKVGLVHCVEGGFHLGPTPDAVSAAVGLLADRGVAYITLAHLIWRDVATDAPALPFMTDDEYRHWLPQPDEGLSALGRAAVRAMVDRRVLIDVSHMSGHSIEDTFALLDDLDPEGTVPVLATHAGYRFGRQEYMLDTATVERIGKRGGVIGLIFARHQIEDEFPAQPSVRRRPRLTRKSRFEASVETLCKHVDRIHAILGSHNHTGIGSDLDGFIKPTLPGLEDMRDMSRLERALKSRYGLEDGERICSGNALRLLSGYWRGAPEGA
jgi:microsomal dipeptidase-like Zn-dependent dipeptidase